VDTVHGLVHAVSNLKQRERGGESRKLGWGKGKEGNQVIEKDGFGRRRRVKPQRS